MSEELLAYRLYPTKKEAYEASRKLETAGINTEVAENNRRIGNVFVGEDYNNRFVLRVAGSDFNNANRLLLELGKVELKDIAPDHPLVALSDDELMDVIAKPDEWGPDNYNIAKTLLAARDVTVRDEQVAELGLKRIAELSTRKKMNPFVLLLGYMSGLITVTFIIFKYFMVGYTVNKVIWFMPGILGIFLGTIILQAKTTLPDGSRVPTFTTTTIKHGLAMFLVNVLAWIISLLVLMLEW